LRVDGPVDLTEVRRYLEALAGGSAAVTDETTRSTT